MAVAAANMLSATRLGLSNLDLTNGVLLLDFRMAEYAPRTVPPEWNLVYCFAAYMQALARQGYTEIGRVG